MRCATPNRERRRERQLQKCRPACRLYDAFRRFGFGTPTGIDLAGEASGLVWSPDEASGDLTTAQNAFGQGLSLTAVQLAAGYASFANGGVLVTPRVVAGWTDANGRSHPAGSSTGWTTLCGSPPSVTTRVSTAT